MGGAERPPPVGSTRTPRGEGLGSVQVPLGNSAGCRSSECVAGECRKVRQVGGEGSSAPGGGLGAPPATSVGPGDAGKVMVLSAAGGINPYADSGHDNANKNPRGPSGHRDAVSDSGFVTKIDFASGVRRGVARQSLAHRVLNELGKTLQPMDPPFVARGAQADEGASTRSAPVFVFEGERRESQKLATFSRGEMLCEMLATISGFARSVGREPFWLSVGGDFGSKPCKGLFASCENRLNGP